MRKILIFIALIASMAACQHGTGSSQSDNTGNMTDSMWKDSAFKVFKSIEPYYLNNELDSFAQALPQLQQLCREHGVWHWYYYSWSRKVVILMWHDDYKQATAEANAMFQEASQQKNDFGLALASASMGHLYLFHDNFKEAAKQFGKALAFYPKDESPGELVNIYYYYFQALEQIGDHAAIDSLLNKWERLLNRYPVVVGEKDADVYANWRVLYLFDRVHHLTKTGKTREARQLIDSLRYYEEIDGNILLNISLIQQAVVDIDLTEKNYALALKDAELNYQLKDSLDSDVGLVNALVSRCEALYGLGRFREAYDNLATAKTKNDSIIMADNRDELNELNKRFEVNELKMESERQQMQAERRQLYLVIAIILLALIGGALFAYYRYRSAKRMAKMRAAQERIENELQIARDIQMSMVPSMFPKREDLDMYASMTPAKEVGGDLYGYVLIGDKLYFAVGDVSGKGVPASLFMAQATRLFMTLAKQGMMPAEICTHMNDALSGDDNQSGMFVTFWLGLVDLQTGHLDFCNAGHNPPVIGGGENKGEFLDMLPNAPIGLWPDLQYEGEEIDSIKGRSFFLYTDGLNEAEDLQQEQFGDDKLISILRNTHFDSAQQVIETLKASVDGHRNGAEPNDDLTMMCLRVS